MYARDRLLNVGLLVTAAGAWMVVALLFTTRSPVGDTAVQVVAALLLGAAVAVTTTPLFWLVTFARRRRIAYKGDWSRALRRASLVGGAVAILVLLRMLGAFSVPLALFVVAMAAFVELILTARR